MFIEQTSKQLEEKKESTIELPHLVEFGIKQTLPPLIPVS